MDGSRSARAFLRRHGHGWSAAVMYPASGAAAWPRALVGKARIGAPIRLASSNGSLPSAGLADPGPTGGATTSLDHPRMPLKVPTGRLSGGSGTECLAARHDRPSDAGRLVGERDRDDVPWPALAQAL